MDAEEIIAFSICGIITAALLTLPAAFIAHLVWTVRTLMGGAADGGQILLALLGLFVPPVGIIHGYVLWF